jgi:hypothetical protein
MIHGKFIFSELIDFLTKENLYLLVKKYQRKKYVKTFICWNHLLILILAQLTQQKFLRGLVASLSVHKFKFNRLGFRDSVAKSNLSKANEQRDCIYVGGGWKLDHYM